jgi:hypothetical protein
MVLKVEPLSKGKKRRSAKEVRIFHASTAAKQVREERLTEYVKRMKKSLHKGYALYELDPKWDYQAPSTGLTPAVLAEQEKIQKCEAELFQKGEHR